MCYLRANHIYGSMTMDEGSWVITEDVEEGFVQCRARWGGVKGTHAQTRLSLGTTVPYSSPLFNCQGRGQRFSTIPPEPFIMGPICCCFAVHSHKYHISSCTFTQQMGDTQIEKGQLPDCDLILT